MRVARSVVACFALLLTAALRVPSAIAQTSETGLPPFASLHGSETDVVSLENGNLHMELPIYAVHQRAFPDQTYNFVYDIPSWQIDEYQTSPTTFQWTAAPAPHQLSGWHLLNNLVALWHVDHDVIAKSCTDNLGHVHQYNVHTNYVMTDSHGTTHPFEVRHVDQPGSGCTDPVGNQNTGVALDGTGITIAIGGNAYTTTISMPNNYGPLNGNSYTTSGISETDQNDANGHLITTTWTYSDSNGASQQIRVDYASVSFQTHFCTIINVGSSPCVEYAVTSQLPQKLTLPTSIFYQFTWSTDGNGDLLRMDLPTGGYIAYTYQTYTKFLGNTFAPSGNGRGHGPALGHYRGRRQVASRTVSDGTAANTWTYTWTTTGGTVRDPLGNDEVHSFTVFGNPPTPPRYETQILSYHGSATSGTLLKTINKDYASEVSTVQSDAIDHGDINVRLIRETTILDNNLQTKTETDFETFQQPADPTIAIPVVTRLNPTEKREYAYGAGAPGALLRRTDYSYLHTGNQNYLSRNIVRQVTTTTVYDGNNNQVAQTVNEYDNYSHSGQAMVASNAIQHDPAYTTSFIYRGNLTAVSHWRNTDGALLTTTNQFDDAGNVLSTIDPLGHKTSYDFTDSWGNASCVPTGQAKIFATTITNALNQSITKTYNSCTGSLASGKDVNNLTTTHSYEMMHRRIQSNLPDAGQETACFSEVTGSTCYSASLPLSVTYTQKINSTQTKTSKSIADGLGRLIQTQLTSDPQGTVFVDTAYDVLGRVATVSNPYRQGTDPTSTPGITTYGYDALGRKTSETYPDGSVLTTAYCGSTTLVTDPTGRWRRSTTDALGRLVEVDEPNAPGATVAATGCPGTGEPIWVTSYTYDILGNLTQVIQNGSHQRNFTYDSLSRLLTSSNPEVGTITYKYDLDTLCASPNSFPTLLVSKTDARGIRTCAQYDAINRTTQKSYSDGTTPTANFGYDQPAPWGWNITNYVGRLTSESNGQAQAMFNYDPMGRVINYGQCTPLNCTGSLPAFHAVYTYDLAGNVTQIIYYPSGRTINYTYDSANRPSTATDGSNGVTYATDFQSAPTGCSSGAVCYTPQGTFYALSIGQSSSFTGLNLTHSYNSRLQPNEFKASSSGGNAIDISYSFIDPATSKNSGHVFSITNNLDTTRSQTFTYDQLNRITSALTASTYATSPAHCWGEIYQYDGVANGAWGNLTQIAGTTNSAYTGCSQESGFSRTADGNNHLSGFSYDVSGNTTNDGVNSYAWDAESQLSGSAGVTYTYDVRGRRVSKSTGKNYIYGTGDEILAEIDGSGNTIAEYIFFGGKRVAMLPASGTPIYYVEDLLGTSRVTTTNTGNVCYDADFYPYGGERSYTNTCPQNYKFEGKERDTETGNDDFGARYYSNRFGRWLSADWSAVPVAVPYANLSNPQTLNLYAMVSDDPESFADLDGHDSRDSLEFLEGVVKGVASSVSYGLIGRPSPNDSVASLSGQLTGSLFTAHVSATVLEASAPTAVGGLAAAPATGGASLVVSGGAVVAGVVSTATAIGAVKNVAAISQASLSKQTGSYTNTHESGKTYDGKGDQARSQESGKRVEEQTGDKHTSTDWKGSSNGREAFKDESRRLDSHGGPNSPNTHNQIESPGKKYRQQDGTP